MNKTIQALTIAGFDSSGGAGLQADLKTFQERKVYGASILTALPVQNTQGVKKVYDIPIESIEEQFQAIEEDLSISAVKTGMLFTKEIIQLTADRIRKAEFGPLVIDPVMVAKSGHALLKPSAVQTLIRELLPLAYLITPNIPEAELITGKKIRTNKEILEALKIIQALGAENVMIKGGHHTDQLGSVDFLLTSTGKIETFPGARIQTKNTHGTGCTLSACITAELAKGKTILEAVEIGKAFIQAAIADGIEVGKGNGPTNHWAFREVEAE